MNCFNRVAVGYLLCGAALIVSPSVALAQDADTAGEDTATASGGIQDIVVTAQKRSENVNKVGMSITALSNDALISQGISDTEDLVKIVPGFTFTRSSYGVPVFTLRGIGFYDTSLASSPTVSVYVDEVPLPYSILTTGAALDLERVEVLKGPQGTLFGQNSTGGAINYIAAKPTDTFTAGAEAGFGRFNAIETQGFVSGPLSSTLRARVAVKHERSDDWQRSYTRNDTLGSTNVTTGRLLLDWTPTETLAFLLNANGWHDGSDNQAAQFIGIYNTPSRLPAALVNYPVAPTEARAADWDPNRSLRRDNDFYQVSLRSTADLGAATLTLISAYQHLKRESTSDADGTALEVFRAYTPGKISIFSQELRLAGDAGPIRWVVGGNYQRERVRDRAFAFFDDGSNPFPAADPRMSQKVRTLAGFGNVDWDLGSGLTLHAGARYTDQRRAFRGCMYDDGTGALAQLISTIGTARSGQNVQIPAGGCATLNTQFLPGIVVDRLDEDNLSWRAGIDWQAAPDLLVYANVSRGYKSGAFPTAGATYSLQLAPAVQESVLAYEAGAKFRTSDRTLQVNGAVFHYDYTDKQFRGKRIDVVLGPLNALINIPKSRITGAEVDITWQPVDAFTLRLGGTHISSRIKGPFDNFDAIGMAQDLGGERFPLTPAWQANSDGELRQPVSGSAEAFMGVSWTYQGKTNAGLGELTRLAIDSYSLFDLRAGIRAADQSWRVQAYLRNLGDTYYWNYVNTTSSDVIARNAGMPRTYGVTVGYRF